MLRKYNYKLETGTVGTNDDNIANLLYNINRMEMDKSYIFTDTDEMDEDFGELFFMLSESKVHLNRFLEIFGKKVNEENANIISTAFSDAMQVVRNARLDIRTDESKAEKACLVFTTVYENLLAVVPVILALDDQAVGRV